MYSLSVYFSCVCAPGSAVVCDAAAARPDEEKWSPDVEADPGAARPEEPTHRTARGLNQCLHHIGSV